MVDDFESAVSGFASNLFFFFFLVILLGKAVTKVGLDRHGANLALTKLDGSTRISRILSGSLLILSFIIPSGLAWATAMVPIANEIITHNDINPKSNISKQIHLIIGQINPIGSLSLMTGGGMSIVAAEYINTSVTSLSWLEWAIYMFLPTVLVFLLAVFLLEYLHPVNTSDYQSISIQTEEDDPFSMHKEQKIVLSVMILLIVIWLIGSFFGVPTLIPAIGAVSILSLPKLNVLSIEDVKNANWDILFLTGTIISIIEIMESNNSFEYLLNIFTELVYSFGLSPTETTISILLFVIVIRIFFSGGAATLVILLPFVIELGKQLNSNTLFLTYATVLLTGSAVFLPFNTTSTLFVYSQGTLSKIDILEFGLATMCIAILVILFSWTIYWPFVNALL